MRAAAPSPSPPSAAAVGQDSASASSSGSGIDEAVERMLAAMSLTEASEEKEPADVFEAGLRVLTTGDAFAKARLTLRAVDAYQQGQLPLPASLPRPKEEMEALVPDVPARPTCEPKEEFKKAKGLRPTIHGIAHAESWAIDLMWDLMLRFSYEPWPREFYSEFLEIAKQEARHFLSWADRLEQGYGMRYGDMKGTETLWECATATADDAMARLAVINLVHEARGLDTAEASRQKLDRASDGESARVLANNSREEEGHVAAGLRWFCWLQEHRGMEGTATEAFHSYVRARYRGAIRPPFSAAARQRAGMAPEWYEPLVTPSASSPSNVAAGTDGDSSSASTSSSDAKAQGKRTVEGGAE